jgi:8-oxo-dGTP pyrophosphatase MutT (NUDIX family)
VLLTHRPLTMDFGPGLHVFPGGAVEPADGGSLGARSVLDGDAAAARWAGDLGPTAALAHAVAAVRELYEEAGVLLATDQAGRWAVPPPHTEPGATREPLESLATRLDLRLRTDMLVPLARWVTPPSGLARRFDTRFYAAPSPGDGAVSPDRREVVAHEWARPSTALADAAAGRIRLWPPTSTTLRWLEPARSLDDVQRDLAPVQAAPAPRAEPLADDLVRVRLGTAGGIPGCTVDAWLIGRERVLVVDPGDPNDAAADALLGTVAARGGTVAGVVVTAAVADHVGGAVALAERTRAPLLGSPAAVRLMGDPARGVEEGVVMDLGGIAFRVAEVPDSPDGALVLEVPSAGVVLTGDLESPGPARGIGLHRDLDDETAGILARLPGRHLRAHA